MPPFLFQGLLTAGLLGGIVGADRGVDAAARLRDREHHRGVRSSRRSSSRSLTSLTGSDTTRILVLFSPGDVLDGANAWIFGAVSENPAIAALDLPGQLYVAAAAGRHGRPRSA